MSGTTIVVETPRCTVCRRSGRVRVRKAGFDAWQAGASSRTPCRSVIQDALPELGPDEREQLISGTHGPCWTELMSDEED